MNVVLSHTARDFILEQDASAQQRIVAALSHLGDQPDAGTYLGFPYRPGILGFAADEFWIKYRVAEEQVEVAAITRIPRQEEFWP